MSEVSADKERPDVCPDECDRISLLIEVVSLERVFQMTKSEGHTSERSTGRKGA